jgi:hypothetical protein
VIPSEHTCKEIAAILIAREDRDIPLKDQLGLRIHMQICESCVIFERQILTMQNAFRHWRGYEYRDEEK